MKKIFKILTATILSTWLIFSPVGYLPIDNAIAATDVKNHSTLPTSLVSYWELEEASGTRVDSTATGNDLTDTNTVGQATGKQGDAADFESANSERLEISDASQTNLDITPDLSMAFWVKLESAPSTNTGFSLMGKYRGAAGARQYVFSYDDISTAKRLTWRTSSNGSTVNTDFISQTLTVGTWYHIALVHDGSAGSAEMYIDGSSIGTATGYAATIVNGTEEFGIGLNEDVAGYFDGLMDEIGIWAKTLTSTEVTDLYNSGAGIPYEDTGGDAIVETQGIYWFD